MIQDEHIEVCSTCNQRYLEPIPGEKGRKVKYICPKCLFRSDLILDFEILLGKVQSNDL